MHVHGTELAITVILFALVSAMGFVATRWRRAAHLNSLDEWALAGRGFRSWISWFVMGGDLYTAYTYVAVPALLFGSGAIGFYALPYVAMEYPLVFLLMIRLWSVCKTHGYVTPADFVRGRFGSPTLALAVAVTGIVATMPYIALNLLGIQAVFTTIGVTGHWPLIIAFAVLAAFTYRSGVRAPALIAFVKDILVYVVIGVAIFYIPIRLGGWTHIFDAYNAHFKAAPPHTATLLTHANQLQYVTLALGSAFAIFLYPHSVTGVLTTKNRSVVKRTLAGLPIYSFVLGLIALFGVMAIAAGTKPLKGANGKADTNTVVPNMFEHIFPHWFTGLAFAMIVIGALVPAAFMSIAAANLFTRNIYKEYLRRNASEREETEVSKIVSLVVKAGALLFILLIDPQFSIDLQLLGGAIILQTLPSVFVGLYTSWLHRGALIAGWLAGITTSVWTFYLTPNVALKQPHWGGTAFALSHLGLHTPILLYIGFIGVVVNLVVAFAGTALLKAFKVRDGIDRTAPPDYFTDVPDQRQPVVSPDLVA
ncbi:monocarboxylate uptake permease MctP [Streptacidiphilus sp. EB103A]|uniref:monocarboxylate uptake permease MctP n=1 Tax=Streptacidiphilus sp. EB103A TaxID=3156275 RepID=UPI0035110C53